MQTLNRLVQKTAVVTAAASGIGRATALRLAAEGARVVALDLSAAVEDTAGEIRAQGGNASAMVCDVTDQASVEAVFGAVTRDVGAIDILVNGVGRSARTTVKLFVETTVEDWQFVIEVSLTSTMRCCRYVAPAMQKARRGRIINIASIAWLKPTPTFAEYAAAKAGVVGFTRVLAMEMAPFGVTVNALSPGPVNTPAVRRHPPEVTQRVMATIPLGRYGEPEEIAAGAAFLASPDADFITGHNLIVAGGRATV